MVTESIRVFSSMWCNFQPTPTIGTDPMLKKKRFCAVFRIFSLARLGDFIYDSLLSELALGLMSRSARKLFVQTGELGSVYHVVSDIIQKQVFFLQDVEVAYFHKLMRGYETFSGIRVLTYAIMDNHFHLLLSVPERPADLESMSHEAFFERCSAIYDEKTIAEMLLELKGYLDANDEVKANEFRQGYFDRMYCLSTFMKCLKGRFTLYYNHRNQREGGLWKGRFDSVIVESKSNALLTAGLYIDMNPLRANVVEDLKDYVYCGYSEAMRGGAAALMGLRWLLYSVDPEASEKFSDEEVLVWYRSYWVPAEVPNVPLVNQVLLPKVELLLEQVRALTSGVAMGCAEFLQSVFARFRKDFSATRRRGSVPIPGRGWQGIRVMRRKT
jgi:hypothetical protein